MRTIVNYFKNEYDYIKAYDNDMFNFSYPKYNSDIIVDSRLS